MNKCTIYLRYQIMKPLQPQILVMIATVPWSSIFRLTQWTILITCLLFGLEDVWSQSFDLSLQGLSTSTARLRVSGSSKDFSPPSSRSLQNATWSASVPTTTASLTSLSARTKRSGGEKPHAPKWAFMIPVMSVISWLLKKHSGRCCGDETVVLDDTVPCEIMVQHREEESTDIELQHISPSKLGQNCQLDDPVQRPSMLNTSEWTDDTMTESCFLDSMPHDNSMDYSLWQGYFQGEMP